LVRQFLFKIRQGAPMGAYCLYVTFGATPKTDQKTSKIVDLFVSEALKPGRTGTKKINTSRKDEDTKK